LALYDQAIRNECGYQGPMPFWDWSIDSEAPEKSEIWDRFGTTGCVTNLPGFSNRNATFPNTHCLLRQFTQTIMELMYKSGDFSTFCKAVRWIQRWSGSTPNKYKTLNRSSI
jgi:hypothetical protein